LARLPEGPAKFVQPEAKLLTVNSDFANRGLLEKWDFNADDPRSDQLVSM
jgi:hypothetical protein